MTNFRIEFIPRDDSGDIRTMVDQAALNLDAAENNARAWLIMLGGKYVSAVIYEHYKGQMWRDSGRQIFYSNNL